MEVKWARMSWSWIWVTLTSRGCSKIDSAFRCAGRALVLACRPNRHCQAVVCLHVCKYPSRASTPSPPQRSTSSPLHRQHVCRFRQREYCRRPRCWHSEAKVSRLLTPKARQETEKQEHRAWRVGRGAAEGVYGQSQEGQFIAPSRLYASY